MRDKVRAYTSQIQFGWDKDNRLQAGIDAYGKAALKAKSEGYTAIKADPLQRDIEGKKNYRNSGLLGHDKLKLCHDRLASIRQAVGEDMDIIPNCMLKVILMQPCKSPKLLKNLTSII